MRGLASALRALLPQTAPEPPEAAILASLAGRDFGAIRNRHPHSRYFEYLDIPRYVKNRVEKCRKLDLIGAAPQKILDIGCGSGLFLYCARHFGHPGIGTDVEEGLMGEMAAILGVERRIDPVRSF